MKMSPEANDRRLAALRAKLASPEYRAKASALMKARVATGWKPSPMTPEGRASKAAKLRALLAGVPRKPEHIARMRVKKRPHTPEEIAVQKAIGKRIYSEGRSVLRRPDVTAMAAAGSARDAKRRAKWWNLRDDRGREWLFKNLNEFIATHKDLFPPGDADLLERPCGIRTSRAASGLRQLYYQRPYPNRTPNSWKGWQIVSDAEAGRDLLERKQGFQK